MAYEAAVTELSKGADGGRNHWAFEVAETDAATASEWSVGGLPRRVTIVGYKVTVGAGDGSTANPIVGNASGFAANTQAHIGTNNSTATYINDQTDLRALLPAGRLYGRSTVDSGTNNTITTQLLIVEGWAS